MRETLTPLDATFLELEEADDSAHMHIGAILVFDPPSEGAPSPEAVRRRIAERLPALPRYRRRLSELHTGGLSWPAWVEHEDFDIADHVRHASLSGPSDHDSLCEWAADFWSERLDRRLPLWEVVLLTGLPEGRWALATKTHHALVDGVGSIDAGYLMLDPAPEPFAPPSPPPAEPPERAAEEARGLTALPRLAAGLVRAGASLALHPQRLIGLVGRSRAAVELLVRDELIAAPRTSLNAPIGPRRRYATVTTSLGEVKAIKRALGGTVNDVVLATVTGGLRRLLEHRGEAPPAEGLRAMIPVNTRAEGEQLGNHITSLFVHLPVASPEPEERYYETVHEAESLKAGSQREGSRTVVELAGLAPPMLHSLLARSLFASRLFNVTVTNVPGPQDPLWAFGARLRNVLPLVPLAADHGVGIAIVSYDDHLTYGVCGDRRTSEDLDVLTAGIEAELGELRELAHATGR